MSCQIFLEQLPAIRCPEELWQQEDALRAFAASGSPGAALDAELRRLASDPAYTPTVFASSSTCLLAADRGLTLALGEVLPGPDSLLEESASDQLCCAVGGPLSFDAWLTERPAPGATPRLLAQAPVNIPAGACRRLRACRDVWRGRPESRGLALWLQGPPTVQEVWLFEPECLAPLESNPASEALAQLPIIAEVLAVLGDASVAPALEGLLDHDAAFVRWSALQALTDVAPARGLEAARRMRADDPHPGLRAQAAAGLAAVEGS